VGGTGSQQSAIVGGNNGNIIDLQYLLYETNRILLSNVTVQTAPYHCAYYLRECHICLVRLKVKIGS
jgi:hypothetical protein